jgi:hypothetical protein
MSEPDILYPAIFVFSVMVIGLLLTIWEFSRLRQREQQKLRKDKPATVRKDAPIVNQTVRKVSNF